MKKLIFMFLAILLCGIVQAQNAEVTLNNGTFVKGDIKKFSFNVDNYHEFRIKKTDGEKADFASTDVKEIKYYNKKAGEWENWIPMVAQMGMSMSYKEKPNFSKESVPKSSMTLQLCMIPWKQPFHSVWQSPPSSTLYS
jgi:hypothetical protein